MVHLVHAPFGSVTMPSLALGQLAAQVPGAKVHYLNLLFARIVGFGLYEGLARVSATEAQVAEWLFAREAWGPGARLEADRFEQLFVAEVAKVARRGDPGAWVRRARDVLVPGFLDLAEQELAAAGPLEVVGFSCTFFQTLAALALGRRLRERFPGVRLVYGGACFHGEMGLELLRACPFVDAVCTGEADDIARPLFDALRAGERPALPGIAWRDGPVTPPTPVGAATLDALPAPDFEAFFTTAARIGLDRYPDWWMRVRLPVETSRGCWWGAKQHCTFCGLNAETMAYRARSADSAYDVLRTLTTRYPRSARFQVADNILPLPYFDTLLPRLAEEPLGIELFWEVKANLSPDRLDRLAAAGVRSIQPGIEALADPLLRLLRKGTTTLDNVAALRNARERDVLVLWNLLHRVPGERAEDYAATAALVPLLHHLAPPESGFRRVEIHRFSPYHAERGRWVDDVRPKPWYAGLFPADRVALDRIAYYFDGAWRDVLPDEAYAPVRAAVAAWEAAWERGARLELDDDAVLDTRAEERRHALTPAARAVLLAAAVPLGLPRLAADAGLTEAEAAAALVSLEAAGLVVGDPPSPGRARRWVRLVVVRREGRRAPTFPRSARQP